MPKSRARPDSPALSLTVQYACNAVELPSRSRLRRWVRAACSVAARVTLRFVDLAEGRKLNREYRGKDHATNVLSFLYQSEPVLAGDLVLCAPVVQREAAQQAKPVDAHFAHMIAHGMLHLQGYDHESGAAEAARMEAREKEILTRLGYPDPY